MNSARTYVWVVLALVVLSLIGHCLVRIAMLNKKLDMDMLRKMDVDGGGVSEMEFLIFMLVQVTDRLWC